MNDDAELLSRWLDGELTDEEQDALRARIAEEPALAALWDTMQQLPADLSALPAIPAGHQRPLAAPRPTSSQRASRVPSSWLPVALPLAAALVGAVLGRMTAPPATVELPGHQLTVDGTVSIAQEQDMNRTTKAAAAGLTVALISGSAWLSSDMADASAVELDTTPVRLAAPPAPPAPPRAPTPPAPPADDGSADRIAQLEFENTLLRGALERHEGQPRSFPSDYPGDLLPAAFEASVRPLVDLEEDLDLVGVDCAEYPCVAWVEAMGDKEAEWSGRLSSLKGRFEQNDGWGNHWIWTFPYVQKENDRSRAMVGIMVHPGEVPGDVATRLKHRVEIAMEERIDEWSSER